MSVFEAIKVATREFLKLNDKFTYDHHGRVYEYSLTIAQELAEKYNLSEKDVYLIATYSAFHDVGKIAIPQAIIQKPCALTPEEMTVVRRHPRKGQELVSNIEKEFGRSFLEDSKMLSNIILQHHERLNGTGYPKHLKGDQISIEAQIVMVADAFDAMTSDRIYSVTLTTQEAFEELDSEVQLGRMNSDCVEALRKHYG